MLSTERGRWGPLAAALLAYHEGKRDAKILVRTDLRTLEEWPVSLFFRTADELPPLEREALELCGPRVIDVGAGAGPHTLALLDRGHDVLAVESLPEIASLLQARGFPRVTVCALEELPAGQADTVLMLMNGIPTAQLTAHDRSRLLGALSAPYILHRIPVLLIKSTARDQAGVNPDSD